MARESFGTRLRSLRERAGLTQTQLGDKVGVGPGSLATWERNAAVPDDVMVARLAVVLGVSAVELHTGWPPNPPSPVNPRKRTIRLTADNFAEHLPTDYAASLVKNLTVPEGGIDFDDFNVSKLLAWVELQSGKSPDVTYEMSRLVAAVLLERLAKRR